MSVVAAFIRRIYRVPALLMWSVFIGLFSFLLTVFREKRTMLSRSAGFTRIWARGCMRIMNVEMEITGDIPDCSGLIVSNHTGPFDILVNAAVFQVRFAPKKELKKTPVIGQIVALSRPVWVDRKRRLESKKTAQSISETIENGVSMLVYPEGTSTDGRHGILPFKSTAFDAAHLTGCPVIEVLLFFETPCDLPLSSAWYDESSFGSYLWRALGLKKVVSKVYIIEVTRAADGENRKLLAGRVHDRMSEEYWRILEDEPFGRNI